MDYEHTQSQIVLPTVVGLLAVATAVPALIYREPALFIAPTVLALVAVVGYAFSSLTTSVSAEAVTVAFRWGRPKRVIHVDQITAAAAVRNRWWYGWGLRIIPGGSMFNVWGLDAVHLDLDGRRDFRIGTDDPQGLAAAINRRLAAD